MGKSGYKKYQLCHFDNLFLWLFSPLIFLTKIWKNIMKQLSFPNLRLLKICGKNLIIRANFWVIQGITGYSTLFYFFRWNLFYFFSWNLFYQRFVQNCMLDIVLQKFFGWSWNLFYQNQSDGMCSTKNMVAGKCSIGKFAVRKCSTINLRVGKCSINKFLL